MSEGHSKFSASAASRWLACPGSIVLSAGAPDKTSVHAAEGTVAHMLLETMLVDTGTAFAIGQVVQQDGFDITVSDEMVEAVRRAHANIREMTAGADLLQAETRVNYSRWLGVPESEGWGTADCIALLGDELQVHDYKHGKGVEVDARDNEQMMLYAGGALEEFEAFAEIKTVRLVIHQPRIKDAPSEWSIPVEQLRDWLTGRARSGAASVVNAERLYPDAADGSDGGWGQTFLRPGEKQCRFCKAKATCPALRAEVAAQVAVAEDITEMFEPSMPKYPDTLALCLSKVDLIEDWCKAIRAEAERRLLAGETVPGFKLVQGKRGARAWADPEAAEKMLREQFRLKVEEAYDLKLISPTSAEKLAKAGTIGPRQWKAAQTLITQSEGKPHVAPADDPRPAIEVTPVESMFEAQATDDLANLV